MYPVFFIFFFIFILTAHTPAHAYIDPGSGGYLFSSLIPIIGGFFALMASFVIFFFRHTVVAWARFFWKKHRALFLLGIVVVIGGISAGVFYLLRPPPGGVVSEFDSKLSGAHTYDAKKMFNGYNLYEGKLIDMKGNLVKEWSSTYLGVIDKNGDYYAQEYYEAPKWGRYTWDGEVIWEKNMPIHHEILLTPQGTIITFSKEVHEYKSRKVEFDIILEFNKDGDELQRFSLWENLKELQQHHRALELDMPPTFIIPEEHRKEKSIWGGNYDYYHLNSLSLIPPNIYENLHPAFRAGNWLIAFRHGSMVFILDQDTKKVVWRAIDNQVKPRLEGPHAPQMIANGNILLLDNGRYRQWSRAIQIDPFSLKVVWEYKIKGFYTLSQGFIQELPNKNMLITEAEEGRVFELTPKKKIVWEFYHPDRQNEKNSTVEKKWGLRQEIYRMTRYPKDIIDGFLGSSKE